MPDPSKKSYRMRAGKSTPHLQRMFKRIYNALRDKGKEHEEAEQIAYAKVNQYRRAHGLLVEDAGRDRWYPGKPGVKGRVARAAQLLAEGDVERANALLSAPVKRSVSRGRGKGRRV